MEKLYCIECPNGCVLTVIGSGIDMIVEGNKCEKGIEFGKAEAENPTRTLTTTVRTIFPDVPVISVRTDGEIPKVLIPQAMSEINQTIVEAALGCGDILIENIAESEVNVIITSHALMQIGAELENRNDKLSRAAPTRSGDKSSPSGEDDDIIGNYDESPGSYTAAGALDNIGADSADGFVGAAGEAVGVEGSDTDEDDPGGDENGDGDGKDSLTRVARPHI